MATNDGGANRTDGIVGNLVDKCKRLWAWFWTPSKVIALGTLVSAGFIAGIVFWGGFNWSMELTNTEGFCISCHEMEENVYNEYRSTIHFSNRSGVRASCPDCHVPKEWHHKVVRKIRASNELWHHMLGTVSTPELFEKKRIHLAKNEWRRMKSTDSRECRNCHKFDYMDYALQEPRAMKMHETGMAEGKTCIDCHRGIAHTLPPNATEEYEKLVAEITAEEGEKRGLAGYLGIVLPSSATANEKAASR